ncbi:MAG: PIN domain-containing protein [Verrucomicrobiia bacterium]
MNGSVLLDTNVVIALFARDSDVQRHLSEAREVFAPSIVLGELYCGAMKSARVEANLARIHELATAMNVLPCDATTAQHHGHIKKQLHDKGRAIPENDMLDRRARASAPLDSRFPR